MTITLSDLQFATRSVAPDATVHVSAPSGKATPVIALSCTSGDVLMITREQSVWITRSDMDGYFVAVFISPAGDHDAARAKAWEIYTGPQGARPDLEQETGEPEWKAYHTDPRGLVVFELGDGYCGSDGDGHLEVDDAFEPGNPEPAAPARCEVTDPQHGQCRLPIGHGADFTHDWEGDTGSPLDKED